MFQIVGKFGYPIEYNVFTFSGGELQVKINNKTSWGTDKLTIRAHITQTSQIMELALVTDALRRTFTVYDINLILPYVPYARQDRVCDEGEALSIKVFCDLINSLKFDKVTVYDVHSDVTLALLNNVEHRTVVDIFRRRFGTAEMQNTILVSPDAGAEKKVFKLAQDYGLDVFKASKHRDVKTGAITGTTVSVNPENIGKKDLLIVDDICDGGKTFIELHKILRPLTTGKISLYVTHGIFSKGLTPLECFDRIYTAYPFPNVDLKHPKLEVI
jgi:ribose-phosphate pyrophosphokinase